MKDNHISEAVFIFSWDNFLNGPFRDSVYIAAALGKSNGC